MLTTANTFELEDGLLFIETKIEVIRADLKCSNVPPAASSNLQTIHVGC